MDNPIQAIGTYIISEKPRSGLC